MSVDLYGTAYGNFAASALGQVRRDTYDEDFGQSSWITAAEDRRFFQLMKLEPEDHVLDIGSGSGGPALFLTRATGCPITGIDVNEAGIAAGLEQARAAGLQDRVRFRQADVRDALPFADGSFGAIVCMDVLCHLPERGKLFGEWHRVLQPGGRALVTDPVVVTGLVTKDELAVRSSTGHFEFCPPGVNEKLLESAGFVVRLIEDVTDNEVVVARRWHDARQARADELIKLEGEQTYFGLQRFLWTVHRLTSERRLSRFVYLAEKR